MAGKKKAVAGTENDGATQAGAVKTPGRKDAKAAKPGRTSALDDALAILFAATHFGRLKSLPKEKYGEELKRVRMLQGIVAKAVAEGHTPPATARALARHFDALIDGL